MRFARTNSARLTIASSSLGKMHKNVYISFSLCVIIDDVNERGGVGWVYRFVLYSYGRGAGCANMIENRIKHKTNNRELAALHFLFGSGNAKHI